MKGGDGLKRKMGGDGLRGCTKEEQRVMAANAAVGCAWVEQRPRRVWLGGCDCAAATAGDRLAAVEAAGRRRRQRRLATGAGRYDRRFAATALLLFPFFCTMFTPSFAPGASPQILTWHPAQSSLSSFWQSEDVHEHLRKLKETVGLAKAL
ncbi:hypothetical protein B296_00042753 [Ensete ventricosum]|uniref:Uncharacterized protein n=1 Tax=Ensete ventricosum TaxID=4639 RepID=A0A426XAY7_ENSVE|nr:hypothetical protein B296_00042753 [Ensete ventricosum]